jgi:hypothetical protein
MRALSNFGTPSPWQTAGLVEAGDSALGDPALRQHDEPVQVAALDDLDIHRAADR